MPKLLKDFGLLACATLAAAAATRTVASSVGTDVVTYHNDNARTGQNLSETILTLAPSTVRPLARRGFFPVDGKVDAQPLFLSALSMPGWARVTSCTSRPSTTACTRSTPTLAASSGATSTLGAGEDDERYAGLLAGHAGNRHHLDAGHRSIARSKRRDLRRRDVQERLARISSACTRSTSRPAPSCSAGRRPSRHRFRGAGRAVLVAPSSSTRSNTKSGPR